MRNFLISFLILFSLLIGCIFFVAVPYIKSEIIETLKKAHIKEASLEGFKFQSTGFTLKKIQSKNLLIKELKATLYWPTYILNGKIDYIKIDEALYDLSLNQNNQAVLASNLRFLNKLSLHDIPETEIKSLKILVNSELEFSGALVKKEKEISGLLQADNQNVILNSKWGFSETTQNLKKFYIDIEEIGLRNNFLNLNRGYGWLSYDFGNEKNILNIQIEAGSGTFLSVPINNFSFILGENNGTHSAVLRANASGYPDISLSSDIEWKDNFNLDSFIYTTSFPSTKKINEFFSAHKIFETIDLPNLGQTTLSLDYLSDRRFVDGPLPFEIKIIVSDKEKLKGTVLLYPDNQDIRGTISGHEDLINFIDTTFSFKKYRVSKESLRLDGTVDDSL